MNRATLALLACATVVPFAASRADTFGSGADIFTIDFVAIGNAGNGDDLGAGGGSYSAPYGGVGYDYRMGTYEIPQDAIAKAIRLGLAQVTTNGQGSQPAVNMQWFEMAAFVNWLNTSTGHQPAYNLTYIVNSGWTMALWSSAQAWQFDGQNPFRHKDAYYFLPSEDEWYKAAFHKNDGVTANYWDFATGSNSVPDGIDFDGDTSFDAVFYDGFNQNHPNAVTNAGVASPYGTIGQNGNVYELTESAFFYPNDDPNEFRAYRGGNWNSPSSDLTVARRIVITPTNEFLGHGFRVASIPVAIPEPTSALLLAAGGGTLLLRRRR